MPLDPSLTRIQQNLAKKPSLANRPHRYIDMGLVCAHCGLNERNHDLRQNKLNQRKQHTK